jgi:DNA-binding beta-propeller fold protein YncE
MAIQSSGQVTLNDIVTEFDGTAPHALSEYYGVDSGIPSSGQIRFSDFYGATAITNYTLRSASFNGSPINFFYLDRHTTPNGVFFKSDGTKMYVSESSGDRIYEYNLSTAWDVNTASYVQLSPSLIDINSSGMFFKPDGTKVYASGSFNDRIYEYDLSTAWDVTTINTFTASSFDVSGQDANPTAVRFKSDGTKMYMLGYSTSGVYEYDLSTAWDVTTASYVQSFSVSSQDTVVFDVFFRSDGAKMYVIGQQFDSVYEYDLSTAWDISTASFAQSLALGGNTLGLFFGNGGIRMYILTVSDFIHQYDLTIDYDVSTASFTLPTTGLFDPSIEAPSPIGLDFKTDGTKMYVIGPTSDSVHEYNLSTAWDISTASFVHSFNVSSQDDIPTSVTFKSDGTKMYICGNRSDSVYEYDLSTAWDISTASINQSLSLSAYESNPQGIFFKPDGTKMYIAGMQVDEVNEFTLSTAWDISTASFVQNFNVSSQERAPSGICFSSNGTIMLISGTGADAISEFKLTTAWDISTASYVRNFETISILGEDAPQDVRYNDDGSKMYVVGTATDTVIEIDLVI